MHEATKGSHVNAVEVLVEIGADVFACDDKEKTPRDSTRKKKKELLALIPTTWQKITLCLQNSAPVQNDTQNSRT